MATKIVFDNEQEAVFIKLAGYINPGQMLKETKNLVSNPLFNNIRKSLNDVSTADFSDITAAEFESHAHYCASKLKGLKIAIYAPTDLLFGISRRFEMMSTKKNILIAREMKEALSWLDVTLPKDF